MLRRGELTRERVLAAALEVLDEEGVDGVTMRAVAARLGAKPMALYNHVTSKADMLTGVAALVHAEVVIPGPEVTPWQERLFALCRSQRAAFHAHPLAIDLVAQLPIGTRGIETMEVGITCLREGGLDLVAASQALAHVMSWTVGYTYLELTSSADGARLLGRLDLSRVSADDHPNVHELDLLGPAWDPDAEFRRGFDLVLEGVRRPPVVGASADGHHTRHV